MVRVFVLYEQEPDPERYEEHAALCRRVESSTFRHGKVFGSPMGEPRYRYYAVARSDLDTDRGATKPAPLRVR